ncbi:MAG: sulfotransferase [Caulobacteraceae bacterium]|nr:sulfotransferase [Caulobacteraceae bacterium]
MPTAPPLSLNEAVSRASDILGRDPRSALNQAKAILARAPSDPRAKLILASAHRRLGDIQSALAILRPLAKAFPAAALTQYELGVALAARGDRDGATRALRRALTARPDLADAWRALGDLLFSAGDVAGAERAFAEHERASVSDPALRAAANAIFQGQLASAEALLQQRLAVRPADAEAWRLLGDTLLRQRRFAAAAAAFEQRLAALPDDPAARFGLAAALYNQQKPAEALPHARALVARDGAFAPYQNLLAAILALQGDFDAAIAINAELTALYPLQPRVWLNHGHSLRTVGRQAEALDAYRRAVGLAPELGEAWWSIANLKVAPLTDDDVKALQEQLRRSGLGEDDRLHLHYALGKALEDRKAFEASFSHYAQGAQARRRLEPYDPRLEADLARRSIAWFASPAGRAPLSGGDPRVDPIFVVGLPRAGSTLVEQILASHSHVEGVMELPEIGALAESLIRNQGGGAVEAYPALLGQLAPSDLAALGKTYLERAAIWRKTDAPRFVDKMPNNFRHLALIRAALPAARVIDVRRHPMAAGFSVFKQHFNQGQIFSYDLADIGAYYRDYVALMDAVDEAAPGFVHRVIYEDLVADTESEIRRLLDYCGLSFEEACLRFWETERAVRTVSSEQVRRPVFRDALEQWRNYEPWLGPLRDALGPALEGWRGQGARAGR